MTTDPVANALLNPMPALPAMDLVGPTAEDDIRRAIGRYGAAEVKAAVKQLTKAKMGRPKVNDWKELAPVITEHARLWLDGGDPLSKFSNYAVAKAHADANPGQSATSTHQRIERKLRAKSQGRAWFMLVTAWELSRDAYPYAAHIRALSALVELEPRYDFWQWSLDRLNGSIADYERWNGEPPAAHLTMTQVEEGARPANALLGPGSPPRRGGLFGLLAPPSQ